MDEMLPSPGFSIPSIGTPLAHAGEDEMILPAAQQQQQQQSVQQHLSHQQQQQHIAQQQQQQQHLVQHQHQSLSSFGSGMTPHSLMQPHTPGGGSSVLSPAIGGSSGLPTGGIYSNLGPPTPLAVPSTPMTPESGILPQLQNIVSTVTLGCPLVLKDIALQARNAEYNPKRFAAVIMRIREPRTTALIFSSGKMVCTGAKSEDDSRLAARKYARIVQKLGFSAKFTEFKIQNMVGSCDVKFPIRLEGLVLAHGQFCSYEPELFPGLIYRMVKPRIVLLIFVSGKVVLTGAKVREQIYEAFENIYPILKSFKKQ